MGSTTDIDKDNITPATYEHLPEDVCLVLEEHKKKCDKEDLLVALASIKVDRQGKVLMQKSTHWNPRASVSQASESQPSVPVNLTAIDKG